MFNQLIHKDFAQTVDVHYAARGEVQHAFLQSRRTICIDAAAGRFALHAHNFAAALRTFLRHVKRAAVRTLLHNAHDFWNHIAGTLH